MLEPDRELPSGDYLLRAMAIMKYIDLGATLISELANATALPASTIIRTAAIMVDERLIEAVSVGDEVRLSILRRGLPAERSH